MDNKNEKRLQEVETKNPKSRFKIMHIGEIINKDFGEVSWLIDKLIPLECITILSGAPASYKTWLFLQMATNIAEGTKFLEQFETSQSAILIINEEDHLRTIKTRLNLLGSSGELPIYFLSQNNFSTSDDSSIPEIIKICQEKNIKAVFIDSFVRISEGDENDAKIVSNIFKKLKKICQAGITVVITHHERKDGSRNSSPGDRLRGSSDILASLDSLLTVKRDRNDMKRIDFKQPKLRLDKETDDFSVQVIDSEESVRFQYLGLIPGGGGGSQKRDEVREIILDIIAENDNRLTKKEITKQVLESVQVGQKVPGEVINELIESGEVGCRPGKKNGQICFLAESTEIPVASDIFE